jgi:hypothetical protein
MMRGRHDSVVASLRTLLIIFMRIAALFTALYIFIAVAPAVSFQQE